MVELVKPQQTFLDFPAAESIETTADLAIIGVPYGVPYGPKGLHSDAANAPTALRQRSFRFASHRDKFDFDLGGTLLGGSHARIFDFGDLVGALDPSKNRDTALAAIKRIVETGALPIVLGGDDSIPAIVAATFEKHGPINVLQVDAHIDFRDEVNGNREGYSSPMRRITEMPWVSRVVQIGARGTGSARPCDVSDARAAGNHLITAEQIHDSGVGQVIELIDDSAPWFITVDVDGFDPSIAPGTSAPLPGGLTYEQVRKVFAHTAKNSRIAAIDVVEHFPSLDVRDATSVLIARLLVNAIGHVCRRPEFN